MPKRRDFLKTSAVLPAMAALFQNAASAAKLENAVVQAEKAAASKQNGQDLKINFDGPTDQLKSLTTGSLRLMPGKVPHDPHQHPEEELMMIAEGNGTITIEGKPFPCGPGSIMYVGGNKLHGITNTGTKPIVFYFAKWQA